MCTVQAFSAPSTVESNRKSIHFSKSNGKINSKIKLNRSIHMNKWSQNIFSIIGMLYLKYL